MSSSKKPDYQQLTQAYQSSDEKLLEAAEEKLCKGDWQRWLENHFVIKKKSGEIGYMSPLKKSQIKLLKLYLWCKKEGHPVRIIVDKARKTGVSTICEAILMLEVLGGSSDNIKKDALIIAHDRTTSEFVYGITNRFWSHYTLPKPERAQNSIRKMSFKDADGSISIETANNVSAARGTSPQFLHCTEIAFWAKARATATSLFQSVGDESSTSIILESTPNSYDELFYPMFTNADTYCDIKWNETKDGDLEPEINISDWDNWNGYLPYFIAWFDEPSYSRPFRTEEDKERFSQTLSEQEQHLIDKYGVDLEQLNWYRWILREKCQNDDKIRRQEYPSTPAEGFVSSGRPYLDIDSLDLQPVEEGRKGYLITDETWNQQPRFVPSNNPESHLIIYRDPVPHHRYAIGIDVAEGILPQGSNNPDRSVACVLDVEESRQVAVLSGWIPEEPFSEMVTMLGQLYNMAFIVPEVSGYGTALCVFLGNHYDRSKLYHRRDFLKDTPRRSKMIGFRTTVSSRPILLSDLKNALDSRAVTVHDKECLKELRLLEWNARGRIQGSGSSHDDHCFALALAIQGIKHYPVSLHKSRSDGVKTFTDREGDNNIDPVTGY